MLIYDLLFTLFLCYFIQQIEAYWHQSLIILELYLVIKYEKRRLKESNCSKISINIIKIVFCMAEIDLWLELESFNVKFEK